MEQVIVAEQALEHYRWLIKAEKDGHDELIKAEKDGHDELIKNLLADLMLFCQDRNLDFVSLAVLARNHFEAERCQT